MHLIWTVRLTQAPFLKKEASEPKAQTTSPQNRKVSSLLPNVLFFKYNSITSCVFSPAVPSVWISSHGWLLLSIRNSEWSSVTSL